MSSTLILAEKPSVAESIALAFKNRKKEKGYFFAKDPNVLPGDVYITWGFGHLLELKMPEHYDPKYKKWTLDDLPIFPEKFEYIPISKTQHQLTVIKKLIKEKQIKQVILATDADREGHLLGMLILKHINWRGPILRFWTSEALTPDIVCKNLKNLKDNKEFNPLLAEGYARQHADWLYGINLTRALTLAVSNRNVLSIGRCQTAVLSLLAKREKQIKEFVPVPYFLLAAEIQGGKAYLVENEATANLQKLDEDFKEGDVVKFKEKKEALLLCNQFQNKLKFLVVKKVNKKTQKIPPPKLFSLAELQTEANRLLGFSAKKTLEVAQSLYDNHKMITYPRTSCIYIAKSNFEKLAKSLELLGIKNAKEIIKKNSKHYFNDKAVAEASHHAILIERRKSYINRQLSEDERKLFELICARIKASAMPPAETTKITILFEGVINNCNFLFKTEKSYTTSLGWKAIYPPSYAQREQKREQKEPDDLCQKYKEGQKIHPDRFIVLEKETSPPKRYTEGSLISLMKNAWKLVTTDEELRAILKEARGIGTDATRDQIIETLKKRGFITTKRKELYVTDLGMAVAQVAEEMKITASNPITTALWEKFLSEIGRGQKKYGDFISKIKVTVEKEIKTIKEKKEELVSLKDLSINSSRSPGSFRRKTFKRKRRSYKKNYRSYSKTSSPQ